VKKVLLIGDSIRIGYQNQVKELLKEECDVIFDQDNSRFVQYGYWHINQMFRHFGPFDIVHFNHGYWDMNIESPMKEALNPIDEYVHGLDRMINYIRNQHAIPIFASTCPIFTSGISQDNTGIVAEINYQNSWVVAYNEAAEEYMNHHHVAINDMYHPFLKGPFYYKCPDMLHLSEDGNKLAAQLVASAIRKYL